MKESLANRPENLSRRDFLTLGRSRRKLEQEENSGFRVIIAQPDELPEDLPGIIFSNWVDFPSAPQPAPASVMAVSHRPEKRREQFQNLPKEDSLMSPIWVEPASPIKTTKEEEILEMVAIAGEWWGPLIPLIQGSWMFSGSKDIPEVTRRRFVRSLGGFLAGFGALKLGMIRVAAHQEHFPDVFASEFSMIARVSSMRAMIMMEDVWALSKEDFGEEPVLAISESKADGLELFVNQDPERLKRQLLLLEYRGTLIESAREAGSVEQLFTYNVTDLYWEITNSVTLHDEVFLQDLKRVIEPYLPEPLRKGEWCA
jgi:hypothetical protein